MRATWVVGDRSGWSRGRRQVRTEEAQSEVHVRVERGGTTEKKRKKLPGEERERVVACAHCEEDGRVLQNGPTMTGSMERRGAEALGRASHVEQWDTQVRIIRHEETSVPGSDALA